MTARLAQAGGATDGGKDSAALRAAAHLAEVAVAAAQAIDIPVVGIDLLFPESAPG